MKKIVLLWYGKNILNKKNRFTGWTYMNSNNFKLLENWVELSFRKCRKNIIGMIVHFYSNERKLLRNNRPSFSSV